MALAGGLSLQAVKFSGKEMASLLVSCCSHSLTGIRGRKVNTGRGNNCQGPTFCSDSNVIQGTLLADKCQDGQIPEHAL
jgi:hypothetical protein